MPTRQQIRQFVEEFLQRVVHSASEAWKGIYCLLLWFEEGLLHIVEVNALRTRSWREKSRKAAEWLANRMGCNVSALPEILDGLMRWEELRGFQRQNPLGIGFVYAVRFLLETFNPSSCRFLAEAVVGDQVFPRISHPPRRSVDIVAICNSTEKAIVSVKWSIRHDRMKDLFDECETYKREYPRLKFFTVTNEFMPARLTRLCENPCIDGVFHVCKELVEFVNSQTFARLRDLGDLLTMPI